MPPPPGYFIYFYFWEKYVWSRRLDKWKYVNGNKKNRNDKIKYQQYEQRF